MNAGKVDVLAVLDAAEVNAELAHRQIDAIQARNARAAVAELIERERVAREALEDLRRQCRNNLEVGALGPGYWTDAQETIDAALARMGAA